jgi:hypothetical protein
VDVGLPSLSSTPPPPGEPGKDKVDASAVPEKSGVASAEVSEVSWSEASQWSSRRGRLRGREGQRGRRARGAIDDLAVVRDRGRSVRVRVGVRVGGRGSWCVRKHVVLRERVDLLVQSHRRPSHGWSARRPERRRARERRKVERSARAGRSNESIRRWAGGGGTK